MIGHAQFPIEKKKRSGNADQRRKGGFAGAEAGIPGEEPLFEIRNAISFEAPEQEGEFRIAESK
jgi:hypothetical protein